MSTAREAFTDDSPSEVEIIATPSTKSVRIKGTWDMYWGDKMFNFVDGQRFVIPNDLFLYLREKSCIYDTM